MRKNEFLIGFGMIISFAIIVCIGIKAAPAPKYTYEVQKSTTVVPDEGVHFIYENTALVRSDGKVMSLTSKLLRAE